MKKMSRFCVFLITLAVLTPAYGDLIGKGDVEKEKHKQQSQPTEESHEAAKEANDPFGRSTPHGTVFGFLQDAQNGKYKEASQYLQLSNNERAVKGEQIARQLHALMDNAFVGRVGTISDRPEGSVQLGVPNDR